MYPLTQTTLAVALFVSGYVQATCPILPGYWQTPDKSHTEHWQQTTPETLKGTGITRRKDKPPFVESLQLITLAGDTYYLAKTPQNPMPVPFKQQRCTTSEAIFTNPTHDFPTKLHYKLNGNTLTVDVTGANNKGFTLNYVRQPEPLATKDATPSNSDIVRHYLAGWNQQNIEAMAQYMDSSIKWMSVAEDQLTTETSNKAALITLLKDYFKTTSITSTLEAVTEAGDMVSVIEKAQWTTNGKVQSQCSPALYELNDKKIKNVWYFPVVECPGKP